MQPPEEDQWPKQLMNRPIACIWLGPNPVLIKYFCQVLIILWMIHKKRMYSITQFSHMIEQKMANNVVFPKLTIINETSVFIIRKIARR